MKKTGEALFSREFSSDVYPPRNPDSGPRPLSSLSSVLCPPSQKLNTKSQDPGSDPIPDPRSQILGSISLDFFFFGTNTSTCYLLLFVIFYRERCNGMPLLLILYMENRESDLYAKWITRDVPSVTYSRPHVQKGLCEEKTWGCS